MDRFIAQILNLECLISRHLKSNMDRFIENITPEMQTTDQI